MAKKRILFLTTANLAMKPRLVKELRALENNYELHVVNFSVGNWTDGVHNQLIEELKVNQSTVSATGKNLLWWIATLFNRVALKVYPAFRKSVVVSSFASNKRSILLLFFLLFYRKRFKGFDLAIGRNSATILPLMFCRKYLGTKIAFDLEDYHPGEKVSWCNPYQEKSRRELLLKELYPQLDFFTHASPLIFDYIREEFHFSSIPVAYLPNSFYRSDFAAESIPNRSEKVQFVWFSVDISFNRGLEIFINVLRKYKNEVELSLYGTKVDAFYSCHIEPNLDFITLCEPIEQSKLFLELNNYDIGLACELNSVDLNKQLSITNKIFAFCQAGLFVIATDTPGQLALFKEYPGFGKITAPAENEIDGAVRCVIDNIEKIRMEKGKRLKEAEKLGWESTAPVFKQLVEEAI